MGEYEGLRCPLHSNNRRQQLKVRLMIFTRSGTARLARLICLAGCTAIVATCESATFDDFPTGTKLAVGTWGGENAGVIVGDSVTHVHVGCTFGDFKGVAPLDSEGRFNVAGSYVLRAFPVQVGPTLPAQFAGFISGNRLTLTVAVNDTVEKKVVVLGPVTVTYGRDPRMGPCPICKK